MLQYKSTAGIKDLWRPLAYLTFSIANDVNGANFYYMKRQQDRRNRNEIWKRDIK
jgi:hypothetical protein